MLLDPGQDLRLRPLKYPQFYEMYRNAIKNTWTVEEVSFATDLQDLRSRISPAERHMINRLVAFFATGDSLVGNNAAINIYGFINAPEARMYLSRQIYEEALHVQFYLTLLDNYVPDLRQREEAFQAIHNIPSIAAKARFCERWMQVPNHLELGSSRYASPSLAALLNIIAFGACVEGLFFFAAFAYVYFMRSKGLLHGLADGTNWVFRDESMHMAFCFEVVHVLQSEYSALFDGLEPIINEMMTEAINVEAAFAADLLSQGVSGLSAKDMRTYLLYIADTRRAALGYAPIYNVKNPFDFIELQNVQELTNFFERRASAYQLSVEGEVKLDEPF